MTRLGDIGPRFIHGGAIANDPTYIAWGHMRARCNNPNDKRYQRYGGRGIHVCARWDDYLNFLSDMGRRPSRQHSLDRINNDGDYEPSNCRWATRVEQAHNRSISKVSALAGVLLRQMWLRAREYGRKKQIAEWFDISYEHAHKIANRRSHRDAIDEVSRFADIDEKYNERPTWPEILGANLRWGAALCRSFEIALDECDRIYYEHAVSWIDDWQERWAPGCGRAAP